MRSWALLLSGLLVWAAHFFALYAIASILPGQPIASVLVLAMTVGAVAANLLILSFVWRTSVQDRLAIWIEAGARLGAALSLVAVIWQALPALFE